MKINKIKTYTEEAEAEFSGLTLLSEEEYIKFRDNISIINLPWWFRSSGYYPHDVACVRNIGSLSDYYINKDSIYVRPALILNTALEIGSKFKFYEHTWTVISKQYALCDKLLCRMAFRIDVEADDANVYESSDVKKYLNNEWEKMQNED